MQNGIESCSKFQKSALFYSSMLLQMFSVDSDNATVADYFQIFWLIFSKNTKLIKFPFK